MCKELCESKSFYNGFRTSLQISIGVAALVDTRFYCTFEHSSQRDVIITHLPWWFPRGTVYTGILFAILAVQSYQLLQQIGRKTYYDDRPPWER